MADLPENYWKDFAEHLHREVSCEKACKGIPTSALESGVVQEMVSFIRYLKCEPSLQDSFTLKSILTKLEGK